MNSETDQLENGMASPWARSVESVLDKLSVDSKVGLSGEDADRRRNRYGSNKLREAQTTSAIEILVEQFKNLIILLLVVAAIVAFFFGEHLEGSAIVIVIVINALIGFFTELRAIRSMESLRELGGVKANVKRDGEIREVPADELVPGDVVMLEGGDVITADMRLIEASKIQVDESALTGESVPVEKHVDPVEEDAALADREDMVYKGTAVTRGSGMGVVVETGMDTELGEITDLVDTAEQEQTPLEDRLDALGHKLIWVTLAIATFVTLSGIVAGKELFIMIETGIALAVAAIPEGLPIVATIALARGMWRMARKNVLINRLSAVETLGSTTVIFTDKTGTLTENKMTVRDYKLYQREGLPDEKEDPGDRILSSKPAKLSPELKSLLVGILCNNASIGQEPDDGDGVGDPMEVALLEVGDKYGIGRNDLLERYPEKKEEAFDTESRKMATYHQVNGEYFEAVKGAPEAIIEASNKVETESGLRSLTEEKKTEWLQKNREMAEDGLKVLGLAYRTPSSVDNEPYQDLIFLGLVGLLDPPRTDVKTSIETCHGAGLQVIMVTGDQAETVRNIALEVGLTDDPDAPVLEGKELGDP
ncbi:MAG: cation-translocating P-type ATPase, partial [bacterium]